MSEREFDAWLSLLGGLLKLSPKQRQDISEELRTHLEDRLEDLTASGLSRDDAIAAALEEFGDAAGLASHFTHIAHLRNRRRLMRWTYGTIAATTCAILTLAALWPNNQPGAPFAPSEVAAQDAAGDVAATEDRAAGAAATLVDPVEGSAPFSGSRERIEAKLSQPLEQVYWTDVPFSEALDYLSDVLEVTILMDREELSSVGLTCDEPVNLAIPTGRISARTAMLLIFEQLGIENEIGFTIRDEIIYVTEKSATTEIQIYNVRDLVPQSSGGFGGMGGAGFGGGWGQGAQPMSGGQGFFSIPGGGTQFGNQTAAGEESGGASAQGGMGTGGYSGGATAHDPYGNYNLGYPLVQVVTQTIQPESWVEMGGSGSIQYFNGLLVIKHTQEAHREVKQLLELLRAANSEPVLQNEIPDLLPTLGPSTAIPAAGPGDLLLTIEFERDEQGDKTDPEPWVVINPKRRFRVDDLGTYLAEQRRVYEKQDQTIADVTVVLRVDSEVPAEDVKRVIETAQQQDVGFVNFAVKASGG